MRCNLALWDRMIRFLIGILLVTYAVAGGPFWAWGGLFFLATSGWGLCPIYGLFKIQTLRKRHQRRVP